MMSKKKIGLAIGLALGLSVATTPLAYANSGTFTMWYGHISYNDSGDSYTVCDDLADGMSAVGWISVRQANGSWNAFAKITDSNGAGNSCAGNNVDVIREGADVRLSLCRQDNSVGGPRRDCSSEVISG